MTSSLPPALVASAAQAEAAKHDDTTLIKYTVTVSFMTTKRKQSNILTILRTQGGKDIRVGEVR